MSTTTPSPTTPTDGTSPGTHTIATALATALVDYYLHTVTKNWCNVPNELMHFSRMDYYEMGKANILLALEEVENCPINRLQDIVLEILRDSFLSEDEQVEMFEDMLWSLEHLGQIILTKDRDRSYYSLVPDESSYYCDDANGACDFDDACTLGFLNY